MKTEKINLNKTIAIERDKSLSMHLFCMTFTLGAFN